MQRQPEPVAALATGGGCSSGDYIKKKNNNNKIRGATRRKRRGTRDLKTEAQWQTVQLLEVERLHEAAEQLGPLNAPVLFVPAAAAVAVDFFWTWGRELCRPHRGTPAHANICRCLVQWQQQNRHRRRHWFTKEEPDG